MRDVANIGLQVNTARRQWALLLAAILALFAFAAGASPAHGAYPPSGTKMGETAFSVDCVNFASGLGVGVTFDGSYLWYSCYNDPTDLYRADPKTGVVSAFYTIDSGLGAIAYDAKDNVIWAVPGGGLHNGAVWKISLDAMHNVAGSTIAFNAGADADDLSDGLAFDATDDTLYFKPDNSSPIHHYTTTGTKLADIPGYSDPCDADRVSGLAIGGNLLFEGKNGCSHVYVVDKHTLKLQFDFSTGEVRDEGLSCDNKTFAPVDVMWSKEAYVPTRAIAFAIPAGTCGAGGAPADQAIAGQSVTINTTEGQNYTGPVATFTDPDQNATAAEYTATINWGDGSPTEPGVVTGGGGKFTVSGSHTYTEEGGYTITVVITDADNPGNTATVKSSATVADATLDTPVCEVPSVITPTYAGPTGSFTDGNSFATSADFTATIDWGDGSSPGTVSGTGSGPYEVTGNHTYSHTGTFIVTTFVKDDGGSTVTITCKTLVAGFPTASGGTFVVGDMEATGPGAPLTWWSSQWASINQMSGGPAPSSMKGFAGFEDMPLPSPLPPLTKLCGMNYTTDTGNSTPPPASVPDDMLVFVSSHIVQNGSVITGDIKEVIVVHNNPGYQPSPGHPGTGTEVTVVCSVP